MVMLGHRQLSLSEGDAAMARISWQILSRYADKNRPLTIQVTDGAKDQEIDLPAGAVSLLMDILESMACERGVALILEKAELTTMQAANALNISRPSLIKLLNKGILPYRLVGKHRRIWVEDIIAYKARIDGDREAVLDQHAARVQREGMNCSPG